MIHITRFGDKVKLMNQTCKSNMVLSADEARNLESEIFELLARVAELTTVKAEAAQTVSVSMDGGSFKL